MSIVVNNVSKNYQTQHGVRSILCDVNFKISMGQHYGILGRNGSGKSTLIRLISGIEQPTRGSITRGMKVSWPLAFTGSFQGSLTGWDNLRFVARIYGVDPNKIADYVQDFSELGSYFFEPEKLTLVVCRPGLLLHYLWL